MKNTIGLVTFSIAFVVASLLLANAVIERNSADNKIWVKGLGKSNFSSDLIVWEGSFSRKNMILQNTYQALDEDRKVIKQYLTSNGIEENKIVFEAVNIDKDYNYSYNQNG